MKSGNEPTPRQSGTARLRSRTGAPIGRFAWHWSAMLAGGALVALVITAYAPALRAEFIWDDDANVIDNVTLRSFDGLRQMWFVPRSTQQYYPLMYASYWVEYQLWGPRPLGYHLVNLLLDAAATILVWRLLVRLRVPGAWLAAAIFAVHPVEVESVAWVTERKNVLSLSLALLSMLCYLRFAPPDEEPSDSAATKIAERWRWYALALALFALALFAKTVVVTLPPVLAVIYWWKRGRIKWQDILYLAPFFALSVALGLVTAWIETYHVGAWGDEWSLAPIKRLLLAGRAVWFYAGKLAWPDPLAFFYPRWKIDSGAWWQYLFPIAAIVLPVALWLARRRIGRGPLSAVLIFAGVLMPTLGFFNVYYARFAFVSDHFQYHASIALIALAAAGAARATAGLGSKGKAFAHLGLGVLLVGLAAISFRQTSIYRDLETLYRDTIAKNPDGWTAYSNLSKHLDSLGRHEEALKLARRALLLGPHEPNVHNNLGVFLFEQGMREGFQPAQLEEAISHLRDTLRLDPDRVEARKNLASALVRTNRPDEAIEQLNAVLRTSPNHAEAHFDLANLLAGRDDLPQAARHYAEAVCIAPQYADAWHNLGAALLKMGDVDRAIPCFQETLRLKPDSAEARANLAHALTLKQQRADQ
jgi:tetratricopeptide (TPR) repeat protein